MRNSTQIKEQFPKEDYPAALHAAHLLATNRREFYLQGWPLLLDLIHEEMATHKISFDEATKCLFSEFLVNDHNVKLADIGAELLKSKKAESGDA